MLNTKITPKSVASQADENTGKVPVLAKIHSGKLKGRNVTVLMDADDVVKDQVGGFINFIREHAIVGLAIGFVVGQQAQGVIKQLITSFIDPAFQLIFGKKLSERTFTLHFGDNYANFGWGGMVYVLLNLVFVLAVIYILIKVLKLDKLDKPKDAAEAEPKKAKKAPKKTTKK
jgi:large-conductance mechanosensitive channel